MKYQKTLVSIFFAAFLLLGSGLLQGIAWCASSLCTTCGNGNSQTRSRDFDTSLMGNQPENRSSAQPPVIQSSGKSHSDRNFVEKGNGAQ